MAIRLVSLSELARGFTRKNQLLLAPTAWIQQLRPVSIPFLPSPAACTHSNHRALRKEETLRVIITQVQPILQVAALFRSLTRGIRLLHAALYRISYRYYSDIARHVHPSVYQSQYLSPQHEVHDVTCRYQP